MHKTSILFLLFYFSTAFSQPSFISNNSSSTGKIIIDGQEVGTSSSSIKGSGIKKTIQRNISNFSNINVQSSIDIKYTQGKLGLSITGDSNIISSITTKVNDSTLHLSTNKSFSSHHPIVVTVSSPKINSLIINGSSDIELSAINTTSLQLILNGAVDLLATGTTSKLDIQLIGAGDAKLKSLITQEADVSLEGSGDIQLTVTKKLNAHISGAGDIIFFGHPSKVNKQISGAGDIEAGD